MNLLMLVLHIYYAFCKYLKDRRLKFKNYANVTNMYVLIFEKKSKIYESEMSWVKNVTNDSCVCNR